MGNKKTIADRQLTSIPGEKGASKTVKTNGELNDKALPDTLTINSWQISNKTKYDTLNTQTNQCQISDRVHKRNRGEWAKRGHQNGKPRRNATIHSRSYASLPAKGEEASISRKE